MDKPSKPTDLLLQIGELFPHPSSQDKDRSSVPVPCHQSMKLRKMTSSFIHLKEFQHLNLTHEDLLIIGSAWYEHIAERKIQFDPIELLSTIYPDRKDCLDHLDNIITLLKKNVFYSKKKQVVNIEHKIGESKTYIRFFKYSLLEYDICFHRSFIKLLLNEAENIAHKMEAPYQSNKEFIADWFSYITQLQEVSYYDFTYGRFDAELDEGRTNDYLKALEWKGRIERRIKKTKQIFPLIDIIHEYKLDHREVVILMYLVKEDIEGNQVDTNDVLKIISQNQHEMYVNHQYVSADSTLARHSLIELSENIFFRTRGGEIRVSPDITRQIIMKTPVNDEERICQILKSNDMFTLLHPTHTMKDLILPHETKNILLTSLSQYRDNVEQTLSSWGLFEGETDMVGTTKKKLEPGLLMLFYGCPGTGKTFAAGTIAHALGKNLLVTDISIIQSKWVGESEKNVRRMFSVFERIVRRTDNPPVLLLNEADQFLSKRLESMHTSVDVMYNSMQNLFLEAFERLRGVMIATTNLRQNLDTAFSRRFHLKIEFPFPGVKERIALWKLHLPDSIPGARDIDVISLAENYELTGGQINIIVKNAATDAASRKNNLKKLTQPDLIKYCNIEQVSTFDGPAGKIGFCT